ncbi:hypothetical protein [Pelagibacterium sp. H642]|uniref:hypothetical protein n=1 Tax=Pelagibacterium sp. H642 TaxID=1881069 RepID=UPI0028160B93|nr:hypothetical protein [Pelagibacterium sp. H642]WMT90120.1 hypothetical protein NO934_15175 [Pelagibacterium sp. H642]
MKVMALDVATVTGWAVGEIGSKPLSGALRFAGKGTAHPRLWLKAMIWMHDQLKIHRPDVVYMEAAINSASLEGKSNPTTFVLLNGLQAVLATAVESRLPVSAKTIKVNTVRKHFLGAGNIPGKVAKPMAKAKCIELGWVDDDASFDRCDALAVWAAACEIEQATRRPALMEA